MLIHRARRRHQSPVDPHIGQVRRTQPVIGWPRARFLRFLNVHEDEARRVPQFVGERAIAVRAVGVERDVRSRRGLRRQREAHGIGAVAFSDLDGVDHVAFRLGHLLPVGIAYQRMDVHILERH